MSARIIRSLTLSAGVALAGRPQALQAQATQAAAPSMTREQIVAFAKVQAAIDSARDSTQAKLALPRNNKEDVQQALREDLRKKITEALHHGGMSEEEFRQKTYIVSTDGAVRKTFDSVLAEITGVPTPGQLPPAPRLAPVVKVPAGPVGVHIGHVVNGFSDTPNMQGLLPVAMAEVQTAIQHATLAARTPTNLDAMKLHAGHVINALDPSLVAAGPGLGYGMKKAALAAATHIELAAKAQGVSPNVVTHSMHVATAARSAAARADQVIAMAQKIQAAMTAEEAAALVNQLGPLAQQILSGVDANSDGRVTWEQAEGGLQQAQEHVTLMLAGEGVRE